MQSVHRNRTFLSPGGDGLAQGWQGEELKEGLQEREGC